MLNKDFKSVVLNYIYISIIKEDIGSDCVQCRTQDNIYLLVILINILD